MSLPAGSLNHRIEIHALTSVQDGTTGNITESWSLFAEAWANVRPAYAREIAAAGGEQSKVGTAVTIRYIAGIKQSMRIRHGERLLNIVGPQEDPKSGREYLTLSCSEVIDG
jgi:SPP1 family predicted phage head-tail adaptor